MSSVPPRKSTDSKRKLFLLYYRPMPHSNPQPAAPVTLPHNPTLLHRWLRGAVAGTLSLLPPSTPRFIYTVLLKWRPLRSAANSVLRAMIPPSITIPEGQIILNPDDPVVSGALMLGVHEPTFRRYFTAAITPGMTVLDIGANIGYYTLIASTRVGPAGTVIAFEPEQANGSILRRMIDANSLRNVHVSAVAIGAGDAKATLYLDPNNKGKHTLLPTQGNETVSVETRTLPDALEPFHHGAVHLIKMDIEGWEGKAFLGMHELLLRDRPELFFEFAPVRIKKTGEDPMLILSRLRDLGYTLFEISEQHGKEILIDDLTEFTLRFVAYDDYADIHARPHQS